MITPEDIEVKKFKRSLGGYDRDEVDEFLDRIIVDMKSLISENKLLKAENENLKEENEQNRESEKSVMKTLESAKKLMKDISVSAEKRADTMIKSAKLDAEAIVHDAKTSVSRYTNEGNKLKERVYYFKSRYKQLLQEELAYMEDRGGDLLADLEKEFELFGLEDNNTSGDEGMENYSEEEAAAEIFSAIERDIETEAKPPVADMFKAPFYDDRDTKPNGIANNKTKSIGEDKPLAEGAKETTSLSADSSAKVEDEKSYAEKEKKATRVHERKHFKSRDTLELDPELNDSEKPSEDKVKSGDVEGDRKSSEEDKTDTEKIDEEESADSKKE